MKVFSNHYLSFIDYRATKKTKSKKFAQCNRQSLMYLLEFNGIDITLGIGDVMHQIDKEIQCKEGIKQTEIHFRYVDVVFHHQ